jgi:two-component system sensor histidine kinase KdpD
MSRLESSRISIRLDWYDINDLFHKVSEELDNELKPFSFKIIVPEHIPLVKIDFGLMEHRYFIIYL